MQRILIAVSALVAAAVIAAPASAATSTVTGTVSAGTLSLTTSATPSFGITLDGTDQTATYTVPTTVTDARTASDPFPFGLIDVQGGVHFIAAGVQNGKAIVQGQLWIQDDSTDRTMSHYRAGRATAMGGGRRRWHRTAPCPVRGRAVAAHCAPDGVH